MRPPRSAAEDAQPARLDSRAPRRQAGARLNEVWQVLAGALVLLLAYAGLLEATGWHARYGEANTVGNEIRWQHYEKTRAPEYILIGSSMGGRLPAEALARAGRRAVNLCLDGSGPALGAALLAEDGVWPAVLVVEANTLSLEASQNDRTLRAHFRSFHNTLARWLPFVRAESRPVSVVYSRLKQRLDARRAGGEAPNPLTARDVRRVLERARVAPPPTAEQPATEGWLGTVRQFREHGTRVVLVMLPDGGRDRSVDYAVAQRLAAEGVIFLDVKGAFPEDRFRYSDGLHLVRSSGWEIADLIGRAWEEHLVAR